MPPGSTCIPQHVILLSLYWTWHLGNSCMHYCYNKIYLFFWFSQFLFPQYISIFYYLKEEATSWTILERPETSHKSLLSASVCLVTVKYLMTGTMRCSHFAWVLISCFLRPTVPQNWHSYVNWRMCCEFIQTSDTEYSCDGKPTTNSWHELLLLWAMTGLIFGNLLSVILQSKQFLI